jgi:hypothetical protein
MPARTEADQLVWVVEVGTTFEIFAIEPGQVDQHLLWRRLAGQG